MYLLFFCCYSPAIKLGVRLKLYAYLQSNGCCWDIWHSSKTLRVSAINK